MPALDQQRISDILGSDTPSLADAPRFGVLAPFVLTGELDRCEPTDRPVRVVDNEGKPARKPKTTSCRKGQQMLSVNSHTIKSNSKNSVNDPPLAIRGHGDTVEYAHVVELRHDSGLVLGRFYYKPDCPLKCGARVFFAVESPGVKLVKV